MAKSSFIGRTVSSIGGGARLGAALGVTAGIFSIFVLPLMGYASMGLGSILLPPLVGYAAGFAIGAALFGGASVTSDVVSVVASPFTSSSNNRSPQRVISDDTMSRKIAHERKEARAEAIAEMSKANEAERKAIHRQRIELERARKAANPHHHVL